MYQNKRRIQKINQIQWKEEKNNKKNKWKIERMKKKEKLPFSKKIQFQLYIRYTFYDKKHEFNVNRMQVCELSPERDMVVLLWKKYLLPFYSLEYYNTPFGQNKNGIENNKVLLPLVL